MDVIVPYDPNAKQCRFHSCPADEAVYGGAKGGGKTCALVMEALAYGLENTGSLIYLFRETYDDLEANVIREWKDKVPKELYKYNESKHIATLYNGTQVMFRYIRNRADAEGYQGRSMDFIGIDELTKHTEDTIQIILSCLRSPKGFKPKFRGSCNPGGIGHAWVKEKYIKNTDYGEKITRDPVTENKIAFIPAQVYDNDVIMKNDPAYVKRLENLPDAQKKAFLYGDWDIFEGQVFSEWNREIHIIKPRMPKKNYLCYRSLDWGYSRPFSIGWWYIDEDGNAVRYRELYGCTGKPDEGLKLDPYTVGQKIAELETADEEIVYGIADSSCWDTDDGAEPIIYLINKALLDQNLTPFNRKADKRKGSRMAGKMQLHYRLKNSLDKNSNGIFICENCTDFIRTVPQLIYDDKHIEDVDTTQEDHAYDETRYFLDSKPVSSEPEKKDTRDYPEEAWMYENDTGGSWFD